jgi:hypothetical protein
MLKVRDHPEDLSIDGKILKRGLGNTVGRYGLDRLRTTTGGWLV